MPDSEPREIKTHSATDEFSSATTLARALTEFAPVNHFFERRFVKPEGFVDQTFLDFATLQRSPELWDTQIFSPARDGRGDVYFSVATRTKRSGRAGSVGVGLAAWADMDDEDVEHQFPIPPSAVVQTSPPRRKYHLYWFLDEPTSDMELLLRVNRGIPNSDLKAIDKARVLRAPGFQNLKYDSRSVATLLNLDASRRYSIEELARAFPPVAAKPERVSRIHKGAAPSWLILVFDAVVDVLERDGYHPRPSGGDGAVMALCPLHVDTRPSLSMHPFKGWKCHGGCGGGRLTELAHRMGVRVSS